MASDQPDPLSFEYLDASDDPMARRAAAVPREVADALDALGCAPLGHALAVLRLNGHEIVTAVWRDADGAFEVTLESGNGRAEASTLFDDGSVVTTAQRPRWVEWIHLAPGLRHHPGDRYAREWVDGPADAVLARHRARLAEARAEGRAAVPVDAMRVHFALRQRAAALRDARMRPQLLLAAGLALAVALVVTSAVAVHVRRAGASHHGTVVLAMLAANLAALPAHYAFKWFVAPWIVRLRPGPPPRRAARMLAEAAVPRGRVRRDE